MRALAGLLTLAAGVVALPFAASGLVSYDGRYVGVITCDVLPGQTAGALKTEFSMTVAEGQARYEREVLRPTGNGRLGVTERGGGSVAGRRGAMRRPTEVGSRAGTFACRALSSGVRPAGPFSPGPARSASTAAGIDRSAMIGGRRAMG